MEDDICLAVGEGFQKCFLDPRRRHLAKSHSQIWVTSAFPTTKSTIPRLLEPFYPKRSAGSNPFPFSQQPDGTLPSFPPYEFSPQERPPSSSCSLDCTSPTRAGFCSMEPWLDAVVDDRCLFLTCHRLGSTCGSAEKHTLSL